MPEKSQSDKFKEAAKEHGCNEDEKAFEKTLKKLVKEDAAKKSQ